MAEKKYLNDIGNTLEELKKISGENIFSAEKKQVLFSKIKILCSQNQDLKYLLLFLSANDVFLFLNENKNLAAYKNAVNACEQLEFNKWEINQVLAQLKLVDEKGRRFDFKIQNRRKFSAFLFCFAIILGLFAYFFIIPTINKNKTEMFIKGGNVQFAGKIYLLSDFYIGTAEVTNGEYENLSKDDSESKYPETNVSWFDAVKFCNSMSEKKGFDKVYEIKDDGSVSYDISKNGYRLPTKAEWYYAASCANTKYFTNQYSGYQESIQKYSISDYVWYLKNSNEKVHKVKQKMPNKNYLYDMSGNVSEWCNDFYWDWNDFDTHFENHENPTGPEKGEYKSICGGFYGNSNEKIRFANCQEMEKPESKEIYLGFRVCRTKTGKGAKK